MTEAAAPSKPSLVRLVRPHFCGHIFAATFLRPHFCSHIFAATFLRPHFCGLSPAFLYFSPAFLSPHSRLSPPFCRLSLASQRVCSQGSERLVEAGPRSRAQSKAAKLPWLIGPTARHSKPGIIAQPPGLIMPAARDRLWPPGIIAGIIAQPRHRHRRSRAAGLIAPLPETGPAPRLPSTPCRRSALRPPTCE